MVPSEASSSRAPLLPRVHGFSDSLPPDPVPTHETQKSTPELPPTSPSLRFHSAPSTLRAPSSLGVPIQSPLYLNVPHKQNISLRCQEGQQAITGLCDVLKAGKGSLDIHLYQLYQEPGRGTDGAQPCPPPALTGLGVTTLSIRVSSCKTKTGPCPGELGDHVNTSNKDSMNRRALTCGLLILPMLPRAGQSRSQGSVSQTDQITALRDSKNVPRHRFLSMLSCCGPQPIRDSYPIDTCRLHTNTPQQEEEAR